MDARLKHSGMTLIVEANNQIKKHLSCSFVDFVAIIF